MTKLYSAGIWEAVEVLWPASRRPPGKFQDKPWINKQTVADLLKMKEAYEQLQKETNTDNGRHRDTAPAVVEVKKEKDDCFKKLSAARFSLRMPLSEWDYWWLMMPIERQQRYKSINLRVVGAESQISKSTINREINNP